MRSSTGSSRAASLVLVALAALATACSGDPPARLAEDVSVGIVYDDQADRWHVGAIESGDRPNSVMRVVCLKEPGRPEGDPGLHHTGINFDVQPGDASRIEIGLQGEAPLAKPLCPEFDTCLREYADHNG